LKFRPFQALNFQVLSLNFFIELDPCIKSPNISSVSIFGSISIAYKLLKFLTSVGDFVNFWENASLRLCAGSVDIINTESLTLERSTATELEIVVFPTPPFPPTNIHWSPLSLIMFF